MGSLLGSAKEMRQNRTGTRVRWTALVITAVFLACTGAAWAQAPPAEIPAGFPAIYYGTVETPAGMPVASGQVKAYVYGELCGELPFTNGGYGLPAEMPYVKRLLVFSREDLTGREVTFRVAVEGREYQARAVPERVIWQSKEKRRVDLVVQPPPDESLPLAFSDLQDLRDAEAVWRLIDAGLMTGYPDHTFRSAAAITRAEFAAVMARALALGHRNPEALRAFSDGAAVPAWAQGSVAAVVRRGLFAGYPGPAGERTFRPVRPLTRAELAAVLSRLVPPEAVTDPTVRLADEAEIPPWAQSAVRLAVEAGLLKPYADGTFRPNEAVSRAGAAIAVGALLERLAKEGA
nr:S-layer homology domain-containing protein [Anaerolineae bacterium]